MDEKLKIDRCMNNFVVDSVCVCVCVCVCVYIYIYIYIYIYMHYQSEVFGHLQKFLFLILKVLFLMKQVKHHNGFIYYTKYKSSWATLNTN